MQDLQKSEDRQAVVITSVDKAMEKFNITDSEKGVIKERMKTIMDKTNEWKIKINAIKVTSRLQVADMKIARTARLAVREVRLEAEKVKTELKEGALQYGNAVQAVYNLIKGICEPLEAHALEQEEFIEREDKRIAQEKLDTRTKLLAPYYGHIETGGIDLSICSEELFLDILDDAMEAKRIYDEEEKRKNDEKEKKDKEDAEEKERLKKELEASKKTIQEQGTVINYLKDTLIDEKSVPRPVEAGKYMERGGGGGWGGTYVPKNATPEEQERIALVSISIELKAIIQPAGTEKIVNVNKVMDTIKSLYENIDKRVEALTKK